MRLGIVGAARKKIAEMIHLPAILDCADISKRLGWLTWTITGPSGEWRHVRYCTIVFLHRSDVARWRSIDAVVICTPTQFMSRPMIAAMRAGKPRFCRKAVVVDAWRCRPHRH